MIYKKKKYFYDFLGFPSIGWEVLIPTPKVICEPTGEDCPRGAPCRRATRLRDSGGARRSQGGGAAVSPTPPTRSSWTELEAGEPMRHTVLYKISVP